jgi:uncharacterized protein YtpQ (UPF0354 family)
MPKVSQEEDLFFSRFEKDLRKSFTIVDYRSDSIYILEDQHELSIPLKTIYSDFKECENYEETLENYTRLINDILNENDYKIDYLNIFPMLYNANFARTENANLYRKHFTLDLDILYVADMGDTFRLLKNSDNVDFEKVQTASFKNINRMSNVLVRIDNETQIYSLRFSTDYTASLILSSSIQKQIQQKVGNDYLFAIPSMSTLIVAKYIPSYINIIKNLMIADNNPNKIAPGKVYRCKKGKYEFADSSVKLKVVK